MLGIVDGAQKKNSTEVVLHTAWLAGGSNLFIKSSPSHPAPSLSWLALPYDQRLS
jgi:hypothetical protein